LTSSPHSTDISDFSSVSTSRASSKEIIFEIPGQWRPNTQTCIDTKKLTSAARNDICRTIVTLLTVSYGAFDRSQVKEAARKLISKYPFMADDLGDGVVSKPCIYICLLLLIYRNN
jgi:hypothetical protein